MLLQKSTSPDVIFIASRILFLATASSVTAGPFIVSIVERKPSGRAHSLVEIIGLRLESLIPALFSGTRMAREAIVDLLKLTFNILTHYPKVCQVFAISALNLYNVFQLVDCENIGESGGSSDGSKVLGEYWSDRLDGFVYLVPSSSASLLTLSFHLTQSPPTTSPRLQLTPAQLTITPRTTSQPYHPLAPRHSLYQKSADNMASPESWPPRFPTLRSHLSRFPVQQPCLRLATRGFSRTRCLRSRKVHVHHWPLIPLPLFVSRAPSQPTKLGYPPQRIQPA